MDVEDEPNSYLKYLNDSDTPNTYLLGSNEVGLFSVEPIFTEMEATDWPQEGFPLLLTNSLISEDSSEDQDTNSQNSDKNVEGTLRRNEILEDRIENLQECTENSIDKNLEIQNVVEIYPVKNEVHLNEDALELAENTLQLNENQMQSRDGKSPLNESCIELDNCIKLEQLSEMNIELHDDSQPSENLIRLTDNALGATECLQPNNNLIKVESTDKYILVNGNNNIRNGNKIVELIRPDKTSLETILNLVNVPLIQSKQGSTPKKTKSVNDLFSTVIANKCKICAFLCEDLDQIKKHISEKHPEFLFTHNGISSGVSLLLSNVKKQSPHVDVKEEFTVFVCSECHGVCTDKNDLKQHMIQVHNLTTEQAYAPTEPPKQPPEVKSKDTKSAHKAKKALYLNDVSIGLVKKQEKEAQKFKCEVTGCHASFPTVKLCNTHTNLHVADTKSCFRCQECDKTFDMWRIARIHMHKEHGLDFGLLMCPMCGIFKDYNATRVLKHMMIHDEQKPFMCQECGKSYKQLAQLKNHEIMHKTPEDMPTWCKIKKCDKCQRFFANSKSLKSHIQAVHENFKPFICNICGHKTTRKAMLELHLRQHTGSKPHKCDYCDYKTGDPNCLRKHMMKHVGAVTYQCPYCPYRCIQAGSFKGHLKNKHKGKSGTFSCRYCSYTTINAAYLHSHEKNHELSSTEDTILESASTTETERRNETDGQTDEETQSCFLNTESLIEETVDNGGITIPAGLEMQLVS